MNISFSCTSKAINKWSNTRACFQTGINDYVCLCFHYVFLVCCCFSTVWELVSCAIACLVCGCLISGLMDCLRILTHQWVSGLVAPLGKPHRRAGFGDSVRVAVCCRFSCYAFVCSVIACMCAFDYLCCMHAA